jgi:hypothetical protein
VLHIHRRRCFSIFPRKKQISRKGKRRKEMGDLFVRLLRTHVWS